MNKYYEMFRRNFPFVVRNEEKALEVINNPRNKIIDYKDNNGNIIGTSIIYQDTIIMLCVEKEYRNHGIGNKLLKDSEKYILEQGYDVVKIGDSDGNMYLMPGIPMATKIIDEKLNQGEVYPEVNNEAYTFFAKRGYSHSWGDANCFDMRADLDNATFPNESIGDTIEEITYRFANKSDIPKIVKCTDDAYNEFSKYYEDESLYEPNSPQKVLIATCNDEVCGTLIISIETEEKGLGSVGCTSVSHKYRGKHIGVNMVVLGTKYLKSLGLKKGFLGYTYSGLDKMYGYAGYKICLYYDVATKQLELEKKL